MDDGVPSVEESLACIRELLTRILFLVAFGVGYVVLKGFVK